jgi:hypothetical protein
MPLLLIGVSSVLAPLAILLAYIVWHEARQR